MAENGNVMVVYDYGKRQRITMQNRGTINTLYRQVKGGRKYIEDGDVKLWYTILMKDYEIRVYLSKYDKRIEGPLPEKPTVAII